MKHNNTLILGIPEGEEEERGIWTLFEKSNDGKLPWFNDIKSNTNLGNKESHNQEEPKEAHFKTHHN